VAVRPNGDPQLLRHVPQVDQTVNRQSDGHEHDGRRRHLNHDQRVADAGLPRSARGGFAMQAAGEPVRSGAQRGRQADRQTDDERDRQGRGKDDQIGTDVELR